MPRTSIQKRLMPFALGAAFLAGMAALPVIMVVLYIATHRNYAPRVDL